MNTVLIFTDTQRKDMLGCYGQPVCDTPSIDRLAAEGVRFERAYTASPVCTPARGAIFTGRYPSINGAWANDLPVYRHVPMMGELFRAAGCRAALTGKWHLDGSNYNGRGTADGGFEAPWWYDRVNHLASLPPGIRDLFKQKTTAREMRAAGFGDEHAFGHCVADRAVDFLQRVGDEPFCLVVSFDEPHDPWMVPPRWWEKFSPGEIPGRPNYRAPLDHKPASQQARGRMIEEAHGPITWDQLVAKRLKFYGCNSYIDREVGRVVDAVDRLHADDTLIIYTSDHGDALGSHGLHDKGAFMYEETTNVPFIVRPPRGSGGPRGVVSHALVSHLDILPTFLDLAGIAPPDDMNGVSLRPLLDDPAAQVRDHAVIGFSRFERGIQKLEQFHPIRCITDGRWKLAVNLFETDELYDLQADPWELTNRIDDPSCAQARDGLHERLLEELDRSRDPMNTFRWGDRPWRRARRQPYGE